MTPEKLHLALNHFVFLLPFAALIPLIAGLVLKNRVAMLSGVGIAFLGSLMTGLVMGNGEDAYERYKEGPVTAYLDADFYEALEEHEHVAHDFSKIMYALLVASIGAAIVAFVRPVWLPYAVVLVILLSLASVVAGVLIADSGGKIRRPDFREEATSAYQIEVLGAERRISA